MQRQSLGSPVSKLHGHGGPKEDSIIAELDDNPKRKDLFASSTSSSTSSVVADYDEDKHKATKPHRLSSPPPIRPDKFIHLIPLLTLLCFLILFLFSHTPSRSDMAHFKGFKWPPKRLESAENEIGDIGRFTEVKKGDILAIRSLRNLKEIRKLAPKSRYNRKFADF
ncbi:ribosome maturation factor [Trema orientale]|uniref:Ribosome maturation factor n=1 Tax=Trema orientale TaxID=63057 RepID=A0A2P5EIK7_TREOI|nr:ribosome maturation factor [Trema orientale]